MLKSINSTAWLSQEQEERRRAAAAAAEQRKTRFSPGTNTAPMPAGGQKGGQDSERLDRIAKAGTAGWN